MSRQLTILAAACASLVFAGCGEKSVEQKNEDMREEIRAAKRGDALKNYKTLAQQFPEHERTRDALQKIAELEVKKK